MHYQEQYPSFRQPGYQPLLAHGFASLGRPKFALFEEVVLISLLLDHIIICAVNKNQICARIQLVANTGYEVELLVLIKVIPVNFSLPELHVALDCS